MLISSSLMLIPGIFANFFHYVSGKYSHKKADDLSLFYIIGVEVSVVIMFFLLSIIIWALPFSIISLSNPILLWIFIGIFFALSIATFCFYFKKDGRLFISPKTASRFLDKPKFIKLRSDAFIFGFISSVPEFLFTLPLYFITLLVIPNISSSSFSHSSIIILYALATICPLFITHIFFKTNHNLADFIKLRQKNRPFFRFFISLLYFLLAILLIGGFIL